MTAMFGIKLDDALDKRISEYARSKGQAKSEIGRRALIEFLDRHALEEEFQRQIESLEDEDTAEIADLEAMAFKNPDWK